MNIDEIRQRARVRAVGFLDKMPPNRDEAIATLVRAFLDFGRDLLTGDISDGPFIHWLEEMPDVARRRFAAVACGRTFNLFTRSGRTQAQVALEFVTCPKCRAIARARGLIL